MDDATKPYLCPESEETETVTFDGKMIAGPTQVAEYTQALLLELREMALSSRCTYLAYLLELAVIEASDIANGQTPSRLVQPSPAREPDAEEATRRILGARS